MKVCDNICIIIFELETIWFFNSILIKYLVKNFNLLIFLIYYMQKFEVFSEKIKI